MTSLVKAPLFYASQRTLKIFAMLVWMIGGIMMLRKASQLFMEANTITTTLWIWVSIGVAFLLGSIKAKYLFRRACKKNLLRIDAILEPKFWQFFRPQFFIMLAIMISAGVMLSRIAHGNLPFLLSVAALDLSIATALLISSRVFWEEKALTKF